jgi:hypothetical protein
MMMLLKSHVRRVTREILATLLEISVSTANKANILLSALQEILCSDLQHYLPNLSVTCTQQCLHLLLHSSSSNNLISGPPISCSRLLLIMGAGGTLKRTWHSEVMTHATFALIDFVQIHHSITYFALCTIYTYADIFVLFTANLQTPLCIG